MPISGVNPRFLCGKAGDIMRYNVEVKEINYGTVQVEANSPEEAIAKAEAAYSMGNTVWQSGEYEFSNAKWVRDRNRDAR